MELKIHILHKTHTGENLSDDDERRKVDSCALCFTTGLLSEPQFGANDAVQLDYRYLSHFSSTNKIRPGRISSNSLAEQWQGSQTLVCEEHCEFEMVMTMMTMITMMTMMTSILTIMTG